MNKEYLKYIVSLGKLTPTQYRMLMLLNIKEYTQTELAKELECDRANINKSLILLTELGLVYDINDFSENKVKIYYKAVEPELIAEYVGLSNVEMLEKAINILNKENERYKFNYKLGCVSKEIDELEKSQIFKIIQSITGDYTDVKVFKDKIPYIVELSPITDTPDGDEYDFKMMKLKQYEGQYGRKFEE